MKLSLNTSQSFNTYAIDWEPNTITWYFNGQVVKQEATPSDMHQPMYMVADIFAGNSGSWEGQPSSGATASMKINYIHVYNSDPYTSGGSTATTTTAATTPSTPAATTPTTTAGPTTGSGSDSLVLSMSEDAYQGDAQFTVSVDGQQQGDFTVTASHAAGSTETFTFDGNWAPGAHTVTVNFLNDAYGGSSSADRNLYVNAVNYDGANTGQSLTLFGDGPQSLTVQDSTATSSASSGSAASGSPAPATTAIASTEASLTVSGTGGSFTASAGDHLIFITGSDNSFQPQRGRGNHRRHRRRQQHLPPSGGRRWHRIVQHDPHRRRVRPDQTARRHELGWCDRFTGVLPAYAAIGGEHPVAAVHGGVHPGKRHVAGYLRQQQPEPVRHPRPRDGLNQDKRVTVRKGRDALVTA